MSKIEVTIYCDTTGLFSEAECNRDNMCDMMFEESIVEQWFEEKISPHVDYGFEQWFTEEYTCDDTDGLYSYAVDKGSKPTFDIEGNYSVFFYRREGSVNYKYIMFSGTYDECREYVRKNNWICKYDDDEYELEVEEGEFVYEK